MQLRFDSAFACPPTGKCEVVLALVSACPTDLMHPDVTAMPVYSPSVVTQ